jgi:hypothetical protein
MRLFGALMNTANDSSGDLCLAAFRQGLREAGSVDDRNTRIDTCSAVGDAAKMRKYAADFASTLPG